MKNINKQFLKYIFKTIVVSFFICLVPIMMSIRNIRDVLYRSESITPLQDNIVLVTFAGGDLFHYLNREVLKKNARYWNITNFYDYSPKSIDEEFYSINAHILDQKRGSGYWLWKPYIILQTMMQTPDGTIILYLDSDTLIIQNISDLISLVKQYNRILFENNPVYINKSYIKRDCFVLMKEDNKKMHESVHLEASYLLLINNQKNREFIRKWLKYSEDARILTDAKSTLAEELPEFKDHRHEQAVLTLLSAKYNDQVIIPAKEREKYITNLGSRSLLKSLLIYFSLK